VVLADVDQLDVVVAELPRRLLRGEVDVRRVEHVIAHGGEQ
jgi:hypothetical protein